MQRTLPIEQSERFFKGLASMLVKNYKFGLHVDATSSRNRFYAIVMSRNDQSEKYILIKPSRYRDSSRVFDFLVQIYGLDSFLRKSSPKLMIRKNVLVTLDWLVKTFNCDAAMLHRIVLKGIQAKVKAALEKKSINEDFASFFLTTYDRVNCQAGNATPSFKSMEELYVWTDLVAN